MSEKIKKEFICPGCGKKHSVWVAPATLSLACRDCRRTRHRANKGRNMKEMEQLRNIPPVKVFTKKEIARVEHLITPPSMKKRRCVLPDLL